MKLNPNDCCGTSCGFDSKKLPLGVYRRYRSDEEHQDDHGMPTTMMQCYSIDVDGTSGYYIEKDTCQADWLGNCTKRYDVKIEYQGDAKFKYDRYNCTVLEGNENCNHTCKSSVRNAQAAFSVGSYGFALYDGDDPDVDIRGGYAFEFALACDDGPKTKP